MPDQLIEAPGSTLDEIADHIHSCELRRKLNGLSTNDGKNYATLQKPSATPAKAIKIVAAGAAGPPRSTKICDGKLKVNGTIIDVTAFRLSN